MLDATTELPDNTPTSDPDVADGAVASDLDPVAVGKGGGVDSYPIVGIGASAGGLTAFLSFFSALPAQPGMAFVIVQHLSPDHKSALAEIIQARTKMAVRQVDDHPEVEPNCVYVIPPGKHLEIENGHLQLVELRHDRGRPTAVDHFFRTLAREVGERAVGVVLSGTGSDGALGIKAIKERAGLTLVQDPDDADYDGMPSAAIETGLVDVTGTPAELADRLVGIRDVADEIATPPATGPIHRGDEDALQTIFGHLRRRTGHDFTHYKRSTIRRRLARRLQVTGQRTLTAYADHLRTDADETQALLRDFLISVTQFFRDPEAFDVLERDVLPGLFAGGAAQIRAWVPGCATGEEAYTLGMLLCEQASSVVPRPEIQVFATDIDEDAVAYARAGLYTEAALADVPPGRREQFFDEAAGGARVKPFLRESVLFAVHNVISDPPFSRLDLVSCRNVLIYFNREIQAQAFSAFHYALRPNRYLFLGSSEATGSVTKAFAPVDERARVYRRRDVSLPAAGFPVPPVLSRRAPAASQGSGGVAPVEGSLLGRYASWTLAQYAPPRLLVDDRHDVTHVFGRAGDYLHDRDGPVTQNVVEKVTRAFRLDLRRALHAAFARGESVDTPFRRVEIGDEERAVRLHVGPVGGAAAQDGLAEVVFVELDAASVAALDARIPPAEGGADADGAHLEEEVQRLRTDLQATTEEHETVNEELRSSNEELQSMNEELQSATEELETSREELQSMNEELQTVNDELKDKVSELTGLNEDLHNLIVSTDVGTLFLDRELRLKRFTPRATDIFHVISADIGRPFAHVSHDAVGTDLEEMVSGVLASLVPATQTAHTRDGGTVLLRVVPYRTAEDRIDGVVLSFVDVTELEAAKTAAADRAEQQAVVADLGALALAGSALDDLFDRAVLRVRDVLGADACKVLRHESAQNRLRLVSGVGWADGLVGGATVPDDAGSQAGYTLTVGETVRVDDLEAETRFTAPTLLTDHDIRSGMSVVIEGGADGPFGVLGVHWHDPQELSEKDGRFLQSVANVIGAAVQRDRQAMTIRDQLNEIEVIYDTAPIGLAFIDRELRHRRINRRLAEINGRPIDDHIGKTVREIDPTLAEFVEPLHRHVLESGEALLDHEVTGPDPSDHTQMRTWLTSYVPQIGERGGVDGINVVVRDITERTEQAEALAATVRQLELVLRGGRLGIFTRDFSTNTVSFDEVAQRLFGVGPEESVETVEAMVVPGIVPDPNEAARHAEDPAGDDAVFSTEVALRQPDGSLRWISARGEVVFEGEGEDRKPVRVDGVVLDVTALKEAEETARRQLGETESYIDALPVALGVFDETFRLVRANARAAAVAGRSAAEIVGQTPPELYPAFGEAGQRVLQDVMETGEPVLDVEVRAPSPASPDDERAWLASVYPVRDGASVVGTSVMLHDVTPLKRVQAELALLTEELEGRVRHRTAQVRQLATDLTDAEQRERKRVAQVLHDDLQQLLYAVQFKLEMVRKAAPDVEAVDATDELVARAVQTTRSLTVDLSPPVLKGEGLEATMEWLALRMGEAYGLDVKVISDGPVPVGSTVHVLLFQLVRELLFNVVKHAETDAATVRVAHDDGNVQIEVRDEGSGFDVVSNESSSGFGLFSVRERVQLVGGEVEIESEPGQGTRVTVVCPSVL